MLKQLIDLTGQNFYRWTVINRVKHSGKDARFLCECSCSNKTRKIVIGTSLRNGTSKSCGCLQKELTSKRFTIHGLENVLEYRIWREMLSRCYNENYTCYKNYGGRGIRVCNRWRYGEKNKTGFECFYEDMGPRPNKKQLDRWPNNDGNYEPDNCRWATRKQQIRNRRNTKFAYFKDKKLPRMKVANLLGISYSLLRYYIDKGFTHFE